MKNETQNALILERIARGATAKAVIDELCDRGADPHGAQRDVEEALRNCLVRFGLNEDLAFPVMPAPAGNACFGRVFAFDREVEILLSVQHPRLILFGDVLSASECDALIELATPRLARSMALDPASGGEKVDPARTSQGTFFRRNESELVRRIDARLEALLGWPLSHSEPLQILRYEVGQEYEPHFDYFDPANPAYVKLLDLAGQRVASLILYLATPELGGCTSFPDAGIEVAARRGNAVFFSYDAASPSTLTRHAGMPVTRGEKWIATRWLRERVLP